MQPSFLDIKQPLVSLATEDFIDFRNETGF